MDFLNTQSKAVHLWGPSIYGSKINEMALLYLRLQATSQGPLWTLKFDCVCCKTFPQPVSEHSDWRWVVQNCLNTCFPTFVSNFKTINWTFVSTPASFNCGLIEACIFDISQTSNWMFDKPLLNLWLKQVYFQNFVVLYIRIGHNCQYRLLRQAFLIFIWWNLYFIYLSLTENNNNKSHLMTFQTSLSKLFLLLVQSGYLTCAKIGTCD